jgi:hypothetical protein
MHWLRESFAYGPEAAEGRILAFTSEIMGVVRLTTEGLSEREQRSRGHPWTFRYQVRHGRVFVGTEDSLQYVDSEREGLYSKVLPEGGFALANGAYAVDVYPINWEAEPGSRTSDGKRTADALPEFVVLFKPVENLREIVETPTPVYFPPFLDGKPSRAPETMSSMWVQGQHEQPAEEVDSRPHVLVRVPGTSLVTGFAHTFVDADSVLAALQKLRGTPLVFAPEAREGALAIVKGGSHWAYVSPSSKDPGRVTLTCGQLVRIRALWRNQGLRFARIEAVRRPSSTVSASDIAALKQEIEDAAQRSRGFRKRLLEGSWIHAFLMASTRETRARSGKPDLLEIALAQREAALAKGDGTFRAAFYELDRMQSMTSAEALTTWLIYMLDLPAQRGLELLARSDADRIAELRQLLASR